MLRIFKKNVHFLTKPCTNYKQNSISLKLYGKSTHLDNTHRICEQSSKTQGRLGLDLVPGNFENSMTHRIAYYDNVTSPTATYFDLFEPSVQYATKVCSEPFDDVAFSIVDLFLWSVGLIQACDANITHASMTHDGDNILTAVIICTCSIARESTRYWDG